MVFDIATVIGFVVVFASLLYVILEGGGLSQFWDPVALVIVYGGSAAAIFICFPMKKVLNLTKVTMKIFFVQKLEMLTTYHQIVEFATVARRDGILALEDRLTNLDDKFLRKGLQMLVDGSSIEAIVKILERDIENLEKRHEVGHKAWEKLGYLGPAIGMVGTLIGLVQMLAKLDDPSKIGAGMAIALLTTFYGALLANFFAIPIECKLVQRTREEMLLRQMILEGIMAIGGGDSPRIVGEKLLVFLPNDEQPTETRRE